MYGHGILTGALATYLANYIQKHLWIAYVGLVFILLVAIQLVIGGLAGKISVNGLAKIIKISFLKNTKTKKIRAIAPRLLKRTFRREFKCSR